MLLHARTDDFARRARVDSAMFFTLMLRRADAVYCRLLFDYATSDVEVVTFTPACFRQRHGFIRDTLRAYML